MRQTIRTMWVALVLGAAAWPPTAARAQTASLDEGAEPPIEFYLEIGESEMPVRLDRPFELETQGGKVKVVLRARSTRQFRCAELSFRYPRHYTFEADTEGDDFQSWTLEGTDCVIMVFRYKTVENHLQARQALLAALIAQYGEDKVSRRKTSVSLGSQQLEGERLKVEVAGTTLHQDVFSFPAGSASMVLILQDSLDEDGKASRDALRSRKILRQTWVFSGETKEESKDADEDTDEET